MTVCAFTAFKSVAMAVAQGYSLRSTQDSLAEKGSKHRMNGDTEKRKRGAERRKRGCGEEKSIVQRREKMGRGEKKLYFGATVHLYK